MSTGQWDDPEYPYLPRYHAPAVTSSATTAPLAKHWQWLVRWLVRVIFTFGALAILAGVVCSIILYRGATTAWTLSDLEQRDVTIRYWHEPPTSDDALPAWLRSDLGDRWWSQVREISYRGPMWQFSEPPTADEVRHILSACGRFRRLTHFTFESDHFSCDRLRNWPSLRYLEELDITSTKLSDDDLAVIGRMQNLKSLRLVKGKFSGAGFQHLSKLPKLETLILDEVDYKVTGPVRGGFQTLTELRLFSSPTLDDKAIVSLGALPKLTQAFFFETPVGDQGLAHVLQGGNVNILSVGKGSKITDAAIGELLKHPFPSELTLSGKGITNAGVALLEGKELAALELTDTSVTDEVFQSLAKIPGLTHLDLEDNKLTGLGVRDWTASQKVEFLDLGGNELTSEGIQQLAKFPCEWLVLSRTPFTDEQLLLFVDRDDLTQLGITATQVTPDGVVTFYEARKKRLKTQGKQESLTLHCDFQDVAQQYHNPWGGDVLLSGDDIPIGPP